MVDSRLTRFGSFFAPLSNHEWVRRYVISISAAALAILLREILDPVLGHVAFYVTVYMTVAYTTLVCGFAPALLNAVIGFTGVFFWFVDPRHTIAIPRSEIRGVLGFLFVTSALIALGEATRRKQLQLRAAVLALKEEGRERQRAEQELQRSHLELEQRVGERTRDLSGALAKLQSEVAMRQKIEGQLRQFSVRLMTVQDEERRRLARDLHDTCGQTLAAIKMSLAALRKLGADLPGLPAAVDDLDELADTALQEVRTTSHLLHPPLLDEVGIVSAARCFLEGFARRSGIQVNCELPDDADGVPEDHQLVLFRILQESLTNVHRHSGASAASVTLRVAADRINLEISDNGAGIPPERLARLQDQDGSLGVGVAGMRERVRELGGTFSIQSNPSGTVLQIFLPRETAYLAEAV